VPKVAVIAIADSRQVILGGSMGRGSNPPGSPLRVVLYNLRVKDQTLCRREPLEFKLGMSDTTR
jgi:hypothetical protein